jgi:uncharacterized protein involved in exopolysaccharide biosynthesis
MDMSNGTASTPERGSGPRHAIVAESEPEREISLLGFANMLLRHRYILIASTGIVGVLAFLWAGSKPVTFTSDALFVPQGTDATRSGLAGLAAQFGLSVPTSNAGQSPLFFVNLIKSEELLGAVVDGPVTTTSGAAAPGQLPNLLAISPDLPPDVRRAVTIRALNGLLTPIPEREAGLIRLRVRTRDPLLSSSIATSVLRLVNEINVRSRQTQASAERQFIEQRMDSTRRELLAAERRLQEFLDENRLFQGSPQLIFVHDRLQREVNMRQQVFTSINQAFEQARIDEFRNVPMIRVIQPATLPVLPDPRGRMGLTAFGLALGLLLGLAMTIAREITYRSKVSDDGAYAEFTALRRQVRADLTRTLVPVRWIWQSKSRNDTRVG